MDGYKLRNSPNTGRSAQPFTPISMNPEVTQMAAMTPSLLRKKALSIGSHGTCQRHEGTAPGESNHDANAARVRLTKECINISVDAPSLEAVIAMEDRQQILIAQTGDMREGVSAFMEKRAPDYQDE